VLHNRFFLLRFQSGRRPVLRAGADPSKERHMAHPQHTSEPRQADDQRRESQPSHGAGQNRTKKDGHTSQIGTGADQNSSRQQGQGARRQR
jgi:hypothetical protein